MKVAAPGGPGAHAPSSLVRSSTGGALGTPAPTRVNACTCSSYSANLRSPASSADCDWFPRTTWLRGSGSASWARNRICGINTGAR